MEEGRRTNTPLVYTSPRYLVITTTNSAGGMEVFVAGIGNDKEHVKKQLKHVGSYFVLLLPQKRLILLVLLFINSLDHHTRPHAQHSCPQILWHTLYLMVLTCSLVLCILSNSCSRVLHILCLPLGLLLGATCELFCALSVSSEGVKGGGLTCRPSRCQRRFSERRSCQPAS